MKLEGKTAVVTGGGTGIGLAIAEALAGEGARAVLAGRREDKLREAAARSSCSQNLLCHAVDVSDRESVGRLFAFCREQLGHVDILVNSAGINIPNRSLADMQPADWDRVLAINATGSYNCIHEVLPGMRARGEGLIVNISSVAGVRASSLGGVAYSAAKFAQTALGLAAGLEIGRQGIRVTNVYPGEVNTPILENRPQPVSDEHKARILQPEDVAAAVLMIATLPPRAHVAELLIKPTIQDYA